MTIRLRIFAVAMFAVSCGELLTADIPKLEIEDIGMECELLDGSDPVKKRVISVTFDTRNTRGYRKCTVKFED